MQDERRELNVQEETDSAEHVVLHVMLDDPTSGLWSTEELAQAVGDPIMAADALAGLHAMGLIHRHAEFVRPTRAATRAAQIEAAA